MDVPVVSVAAVPSGGVAARSPRAATATVSGRPGAATATAADSKSRQSEQLRVCASTASIASGASRPSTNARIVSSARHVMARGGWSGCRTPSCRRFRLSRDKLHRLAMGKLTDAYVAARGTGEGGAAGPPASDLEEALQALWVRGRAGHPELDIGDTTFAAHLAACGAAIAPGTQAEDLYLVCAGLGGAAAAIAKLRRIHRPVLASYLRRIDGSPDFVDEVEQQVWHALLIGGEGAR